MQHLEYPDIYFEPSYAKIYTFNQEEVHEFIHKNEYGLISNLFIKRKIEVILPDGNNYFDIVTPYGYGGPFIHYFTDKEKLITSYMETFEEYALNNNIISEFVRFHPILGNGVDFEKSYNSIFERKTVGTNLTFKDVITSEFSKHKRKEIKKILNNPDIHYEIDENPQDLTDFIKIYYSTMDRNGANKYYYFDNEYFQKLLRSLPKNLITCKVFHKNQLISMGIYFRYNKFLHAHLSGTLSEYLEFSPSYLLKYAMAIYGHEKGFDVIHYGGGSSPSPENGLYKFKKDFGNKTEFDFYIAKKIWNEKKYKEICELTHSDINSAFFPAYRNQR